MQGTYAGHVRVDGNHQQYTVSRLPIHTLKIGLTKAQQSYYYEEACLNSLAIRLMKPNNLSVLQVGNVINVSFRIK